MPVDARVRRLRGARSWPRRWPVAAAVALLTFTLVPAASAQPPDEGYRLVDTWTSRRPYPRLPDISRPTGLDVADDDTIYVADRRTSTLYRISPDAELIDGRPTDPGIGRPRDIALLPDRIYVLGDSGGQVFAPDGTTLGTWSGTGWLGIAAGSDRKLYLSRLETVDDQPSAVIDVLDVDGGRLEMWRGQLSIRTAFGLDVGPDGRVYLAADGAVYAFEDGSIEALLRVEPALEGPDVTDVAVDPEGRVIAAQGNRLVSWDAEGHSGPHLALPGAIWVAVGPEAGVVVSTATTAGPAGLSYVADRTTLAGPVHKWGQSEPDLGQLKSPRRLGTAPDGDVYILDSLESRARIQRWSAGGQPIEQWDASSFGDVLGGRDWPCYVAGRTIGCLGPAGTLDWTAAPSPHSWFSVGDASAAGSAAVDLASQRTWLFDAGGSVVDGWSLGPDHGYAAITDLAVASERVYLADRSTGQVAVRGWGGDDLARINVPYGASRLAHGSGMLFVLSRDGWIRKLDEEGRLRAAWQPVADSVALDLAVGPAGRVYVAVAGGEDAEDRILVFEPGGPPATPPEAPPPDRCLVNVDKTAAPARVYPGEIVTIVLTASGQCPAEESRVDVALILDRSGSMRDRALAAAQAAAISFVNELDYGAAQVAVLAFSDTAQLLQPLSEDLQGAVRAIAGLTAGGQTRYSPVLDMARTELTGPDRRRDVEQLAILMTDGYPTDATQVMAAAGRLKSSGVTLHTIGLGTQVDANMLSEMASSPELFHLAPTDTSLAQIYADIARRVVSKELLRSGTVTDLLPPDMWVVPGSVTPSASRAGPELRWHLAAVPATGTKLSYQVRPQRSGRRPTNLQAVLEYEDALDQTGSSVFPVPYVDVLRRTEWQTYLPLVHRYRCRRLRADVVFVFDASSSMTGPASPGSASSKLEAALAAGATFLDAMVLPGDKGAIVTFDDESRLVQPLTGSRAQLGSALVRVRPGEGTRIDRGLALATSELLSARHVAANNPVVILLTDGRPTPGYEEQTRQESLTARSLGFTLYAIGLGQDADMDLLGQLTADPSRVYFAPDANALRAIYGRIAGQVLCE